jgi:hypothetical protein
MAGARVQTLLAPPDPAEAPPGPYRVWAKHGRGARQQIGEDYTSFAEAVDVAKDQLIDIGVTVYIRDGANKDVAAWRVGRVAGTYTRRH